MKSGIGFEFDGIHYIGFGGTQQWTNAIYNFSETTGQFQEFFPKPDGLYFNYDSGYLFPSARLDPAFWLIKIMVSYIYMEVMALVKTHWITRSPA